MINRLTWDKLSLLRDYLETRRDEIVAHKPRISRLAEDAASVMKFPVSYSNVQGVLHQMGIVYRVKRSKAARAATPVNHEDWCVTAFKVIANILHRLAHEVATMQAQGDGTTLRMSSVLKDTERLVESLKEEACSKA